MMGDISEQDIGIFYESVRNYFDQITSESAEVRGAYLSERGQVPEMHDFTGMIAVSGHYHGCIYFSAPRQMLRHLLVAMHELDQGDENLLDAVGEVANTIAGNARKYFGEHMEISVPIAVSGIPDRIRSSARARPYVIQISWKHYESVLIVDVEREKTKEAA